MSILQRQVIQSLNGLSDDNLRFLLEMKILIDTHIAIWAVLNDPKLTRKAKELLLDMENEKLMFLTHDSLIPYYEESFIITV